MERNDLETMARHFLSAASSTCESVGDLSWRLGAMARQLEGRTSEIRGRLVRLGLRIAWELTAPGGKTPPAGTADPSTSKEGK